MITDQIGPEGLIRRKCSISDFCARHGISRSTFYVQGRKGKMPTITKIGTRSIILPEDEAAWAERQRAERSVEAA